MLLTTKNRLEYIWSLLKVTSVLDNHQTFLEISKNIVTEPIDEIWGNLRDLAVFTRLATLRNQQPARNKIN